MASFTLTIKLNHRDLMGRIPTPKKGGAMKVKKGKGSYNRKAKHVNRRDW